MTKVIHVIPHDGVGGVETAARSMANADSLSCDFKLMLIAGQSLSVNPDHVIESPFRSANNPFAHVLSTFRLVREKPDVLICSLWRSISVGVLLKLLRPRTKLVSFLHTVTTVHLLDCMMHALMMRFADAVWADSAATLRARVKFHERRPSEIISFVIDDTQFDPRTNVCSLRFVFWGRMNHHKGLDRAIELIAEMIKYEHDVQFEIWGPDDGEKSNLLALVRKNNLEEHIHFMGLAEPGQLNEIASRHSFYLQLSRTEGMAMSVVEAMQKGLVPVVTPVGEITNYCKAGKNAVVVYSPENSLGAIRDVLALLRDEKLYRQFQDAAQETWREANLYRDDFCRAVEQLVRH